MPRLEVALLRSPPAAVRGPSRSEVGDRSLMRRFGLVVLLAATYLVTGKLGLLMAIPPGVATPVWPPSGIAVAAVLLLGPRVWPGIWIGSFLLNFGTLLSGALTQPSAAAAVAVGIATGSTVQPLIGAWILVRAIGTRHPLQRARDALRFALFTAVFGCMTSATIGVTSVCLAQITSWTAFGVNWTTWWLGDAVGVLIVTPLLLSWSGRTAPGASNRWMELALCFALVLSVGCVAFSTPAANPLVGRLLAVSLIPCLLWAAIRFGAQEALAMLVAITGLAVWGTIQHTGPFTMESLDQSRLLLEGFLAIAAVTALGVGAAVTERRTAEAGLRQVNVELEERVRERTSELSTANQALHAEIVERKQAETERLHLERKLQEAQRLESLGVMSGGIAHDFNNLLTAILGTASLARTELAPTSSAQLHLESIESASRRAADLCQQLLAYAGRGRFVIDHLDLNLLVAEIVHLLQTSVGARAEMRFEPAPALPAVEGDATQLRQVVMNLVINAAEAAEGPAGTIRLRTGTQHLDQAALAETHHGTPVQEGEYVFLEIADEGCGMSAETMAKIFDPFFTTKFTGRGLGLSAVLGIVKGHRGALRVTSTVGRGTTFRLLLPIAAGKPSKRPDAVADCASWRGHGCVLVVDDEPVIRTYLERVLRGLGFEVLLARDGREGVELFKEHAARLVAVLLDLTMPRMGGSETYVAMRAIRSDVPVVLMSGYDEEEAIRRFDNVELTGSIHKPFTPTELAGKLRSILG